jgi:hypothetical protein
MSPAGFTPMNLGASEVIERRVPSRHAQSLRIAAASAALLVTVAF